MFSTILASLLPLCLPSGLFHITPSLDSILSRVNEGIHLSWNLMFHCHFRYSATRFYPVPGKSNYCHSSLTFVVLVSFHLLLGLPSAFFPAQIYINWYVYICVYIGSKTAKIRQKTKFLLSKFRQHVSTLYGNLQAFLWNKSLNCCVHPWDPMNAYKDKIQRLVPKKGLKMIV
jgi:hypothetical protein